MIQPDTRALELSRYWNLGPLELMTRTASANIWHAPCVDRVLKHFTPTGQKDEAGGTHWLRWANGNGAVHLFDHTDDAQLLAYCAGPDATSLPDAFAIQNICGAIMQFPGTASPHGLTPLDIRLSSLLIHPDTPNDTTTFARTACRALLARPPATRPLHGDIHHGNTLQTGKRWVLIDPKGLIGDPHYDVANMFFNPVSDPKRVKNADRAQLMARQLAETLGYCPNRLLCFAFVHATIAGIWAEEDGQDPQFAFDVAEILKPMAREVFDAIVA